MTREGFAANNRGIAAGGNLEESFLNEIFDHIRANPISLKEDDQAREKGENQVRAAVRYHLAAFDALSSSNYRGCACCCGVCLPRGCGSYL